MMRALRRPHGLVLGFLLVGATTSSVSFAAGQTQPLDVAALAQRALERFDVVGMGVAVVKDGEIVYAGGFGELEKGSGQGVDADTVFAIGSNTKAFTAAGLGVLVDEGRLDWSDKVTEHLPWFALHDPYVTGEITVRDILSHRSGLGRRGDMNWYATDFDREELVRRIRFLDFQTGFRETAGYQNTMFIAAGLVAEAISGRTWDEWLTERLIEPLGMVRTRTSVTQLGQLDNVASPHQEIDGVVVPVPHRNIDNAAPAGSILSSVRDMTAWMRLMLDDGVWQGEQILSTEVVRDLWTPSTLYPYPPAAAALFPMTKLSAYGLGWGLRDYRGTLLASHTGGIDGMLSSVLLAPEQEFGIVVLTNTSPAGTYAHGAITYQVLDAYLGATDARDWLEIYTQQQNEQAAAGQAAAQQRAAARAVDTSPSLPLARYVGRFEDPMYGIVEIFQDDDALRLRRHTDWSAELQHWHYDTFNAVFDDPVIGELLITFALDAAANVASLRLEGLAEANFRRIDTPTD